MDPKVFWCDRKYFAAKICEKSFDRTKKLYDPFFRSDKIYLCSRDLVSYYKKDSDRKLKFWT